MKKNDLQRCSVQREARAAARTAFAYSRNYPYQSFWLTFLEIFHSKMFIFGFPPTKF